MEPLFHYAILSLAFICTVKIFFQIQSRRIRNLPPGPPTLPIIGNLHHLKQPIHRTFSALSQTYGDILSLWFGSRLVVVVSSPSLVQECFTKNDIVLANRPRFIAGKYIFYNYTTLGSASYGDHWRNLRRITTIDVLSTNRLNSFLGIRRDETKRLIWKLGQDATCHEPTKVELRSRLTEMTFNAMMRMISGKRYYGEDIDVTDVEEAKQFREIITEMLSLFGANNKSDFLPLLRYRINDDKRLKRIGKRADAFLQGLIEEHRSGKHGSADTMIDHLLKLSESQPEYYSDHIIKGLIQAMLLAGTDTSAVTIEWVMSELLNHPEVLKKAKDEIDTHVGKERLVQEQDLSKLPYLQNIISETLRLHPPAPLLLPHYSSEDCTIGGYNIPRDTIVLTNAWLIHRDPKLWNDPTSFKPERFEKEGEVTKLIAFGLGRRACPGLGLAQRTVGFTMALLIQCFEWERESEEKLDMMEDKGITMPKLIPLQALCKSRPIVNDVMN
ncbi:isoflavone 3'-hydroxylase-like isoform X2 [Abrus precatorius]|uniref:Isoflavone 3'-hydroxylase-like isoform X2 n=1 Tax=Abrus precatorius TaxID=3816 RepID=A0A8B8JD35_ABRPR|nr:isoflavone 3'-hydroxylase-like isoform X2 [Abrus precatorius]